MDAETIAKMKEAGCEKPNDIKHDEWNQPTDISAPIYETVAYLAARGLSENEIAGAISRTAHWVKRTLASDRMQFEVKRIRFALFGKDTQKKFNEVLPIAIEATEKILKDKATKPATKLNAAIYMIDRALGKPKQNVEVESNLVKDIMSILDGRRQATLQDLETVIEVQEVPALSAPNPQVEPVKTEVIKEDEEAKWVAENL